MNVSVLPKPQLSVLTHKINGGIYSAPDDYVRALYEKSVNVSDGARRIIARGFECAQGLCTFRVSLLTLSDLGIEPYFNTALYGNVCAAGIRKGYALCPPEVGPALCLVHDTLPLYVQGKWILLAMEPFEGCGDIASHGVFGMGSNVGSRLSGLHLRASPGRPNSVYGSNELFVFIS